MRHDGRIAERAVGDVRVVDECRAPARSGPSRSAPGSRRWSAGPPARAVGSCDICDRASSASSGRLECTSVSASSVTSSSRSASSMTRSRTSRLTASASAGRCSPHIRFRTRNATSCTAERGSSPGTVSASSRSTSSNSPSLVQRLGPENDLLGRHRLPDPRSSSASPRGGGRTPVERRAAAASNSSGSAAPAASTRATAICSRSLRRRAPVGLDPIGTLQEEPARRQRSEAAADHLAIQRVDEAHLLATAIERHLQQPRRGPAPRPDQRRRPTRDRRGRAVPTPPTAPRRPAPRPTPSGHRSSTTSISRGVLESGPRNHQTPADERGRRGRVRRARARGRTARCPARRPDRRHRVGMDRSAEHEVEQRVDVVSTELAEVDPHHVVTPPQGSHDRSSRPSCAHGRDQEHLAAVQELGEQTHGRRVEVLEIIDVHHEPPCRCGRPSTISRYRSTGSSRVRTPDGSRCANAPNGIVAATAVARARTTTRPSRSARSTNSAARRDLPTPAAPWITTRTPSRSATHRGHGPAPRGDPRAANARARRTRPPSLSFAYSSRHSTSTTREQWPP